MTNRRFAILFVAFTLSTTLIYTTVSFLGLNISTAHVFQRGAVPAPHAIFRDPISVTGEGNDYADAKKGKFLNSIKDSTKDSTKENQSHNLGIASKIFVVSLPSRSDRREQMRHLLGALGLRWSYEDAVSSERPIVDAIMRTVRRRRGFTKKPTFRWPKDINAVASTTGPIPRAGSELWTSLDSRDLSHPQNPSPPRNNSGASLTSENPLTCATEDDTIPDHSPNLPHNKILTLAKVAVWESHLSVVRKAAEDTSTDINIHGERVSIILEDDIDMEWDIHDRIASIWSLLPKGWDAVFLGHCWSNESYYPALYPPDSDTPQYDLLIRNMTRLHPSLKPKCTHAYALSRSGARRLLLHLRHPAFAYSRAIDQAFAWLVQSGRIRAYSVVPSIVVQRKVGESDVMEGIGSTWREGLFRGVLDNSFDNSPV